MLYAAETLRMIKKEEDQLRIMEWKIMMTYLGQVKTAENES